MDFRRGNIRPVGCFVSLSAVARRFSGGAVGLLAKHLERAASASEFHAGSHSLRPAIQKEKIKKKPGMRKKGASNLLPAHEYIGQGLSLLLRSVGHRVKPHNVTPAPDNERGDIEIKDYVMFPRRRR